jgi:uncharacterized protein YraI
MFKKQLIKKICSIAMAAAVFLAVFAAAVPAQPAAAADNNWRARYWNNKTFTGDPVLERSEADINYNWGQGSPHSSVNTSNFSARWNKKINLAEGSYRFTATMDDGMRVWVDNAIILDSWYDSQEHSLSATLFLSSGDHDVKVEYYDAGGAAVAKMKIEPLSVAISQFRGEYFNNMTLSGTPAFVRNDNEINFNWGGGSPGSGVGADMFSVRWSRDIVLDAGRYRFTATADDGLRLWVNNRLLIDKWFDQAATPYSAEIDLPGGSVPIRMEYYEHVGGAEARLFRTKVAGLPGVTQWRGEYFNNTNLSGSPALVRNDAHIDFKWGNGSPASGINADNFSARWTRTIYFNPGRYRFTANTDDGVRVWVNDQLIINAWNDHKPEDIHAEIDLPAGNAVVKMEYYEHVGGARASLTRTQISNPPAPAPQPITGATATVSSLRLNVRQGPGTEHAIVTTVNRGDLLTLAGYRNAAATWVRVVLANGTQGWVFAGLIQSSYPISNLIIGDGPAIVAPTPTTPAPSGATARVTAFHLNVRQGPAVSFSIITQINRDQIVSLAGVRNAAANWVKIILPNGTQGWVNASFVTTSVPVSSLPVGN